MANLQFIKAYNTEIKPPEIREKFDFEIKSELFKTIGYDLLYQYIIKYLELNPGIKIITIGGNNEVSNVVIQSICDKHKSDIKILCINKTPFYQTDSNQVIYFGLDIIQESEHICMTVDKINQVGIKDITSCIMNIIGSSPLHISLSMKIFDAINITDMLYLLDKVKNNVLSLDIIDITNKEMVHKCLMTLFNIKEKKINVFNEHSEFLIYRPIEQEAPEDVGWYILRGIDINEQEQIMKELDEDKLLHVEINDDMYIITKTSMEEQNKKTYFATTCIADAVLFPLEKEAMCFELINH